MGTAIFDSTWYDLPPNDAKTLLIPLQRTGKPLEVTAGKFVVFSLNLFSNVSIRSNKKAKRNYAFRKYYFHFFLLNVFYKILVSVSHLLFKHFITSLQIVKTSAGYLSMLLAVRDKL